MKKRFIVLIDFSPYSEKLLYFAYNWARQIEYASLVLVHQSEEPVPGMGDSSAKAGWKQNNTQKAQERLREFADNLLMGESDGLEVMAGTSHLSNIITEIKREDTVDYIFAGMNKKSAIEQFFVGSTVLHLSDELDNIIIALPADREDIDMSNLFIAVTEKYPVNKQALEDLLAVRGTAIQRVIFFSVLTTGADEVTQLENLESLSGEYSQIVDVSYNLIKSDKPSSAIKDYLLGNKGILVIQKGSRDFPDIFRRQLTPEMVYLAQVPVIILPAVAEE